MPAGSAHFLQQLLGFEAFNPLAEVLRMLRCGIGLKDAHAGLISSCEGYCRT